MKVTNTTNYCDPMGMGEYTIIATEHPLARTVPLLPGIPIEDGQQEMRAEDVSSLCILSWAQRRLEFRSRHPITLMSKGPAHLQKQ